MPLLIYVVLQSNPEHLVSNVQYILRFRNQEKLGGEAGYYLSSLVCTIALSLPRINEGKIQCTLTLFQMGAIQFIENMDRTTLTITDDEFERNVEAAVSAIAEKHKLNSPVLQSSQMSEKFSTSLHLPGEGPRRSMEASAGEPSTPRRSTSSNEAGDSADEKAAITGLLRSIQKPLTTIGRMFSEDVPHVPAGPSSAPRTPAQSEGLSPRPSGEQDRNGSRPSSRHQLSAEEAAARQASAEVAEAQRLHRAEHANIVETLSGMFPDLDREVISDVVYQKEGRYVTILSAPPTNPARPCAPAISFSMRLCDAANLESLLTGA